MTVVLDASALLAFLQGETGAEVVEEYLLSGAACGAANWSEVAQKVSSAAEHRSGCSRPGDLPAPAVG